MLEAEVKLEEATLITRCQQGDAGAFDRLIAAHSGRVYNLAYRMLGSAPDAEDAAQEAFVRAFSSIKRFRGNASFATWLHRITVNVCLDELKRRRGRPQPLTSFINQNDDPAQEKEDYLLGNSSAADPQVVFEQRLKQKEVQTALNALPELHRAVVVLCDMEGCSYEEAAAALNTNTGTIKSRLHRARQSLRQILAPSKELSSEQVGQNL